MKSKANREIIFSSIHSHYVIYRFVTIGTSLSVWVVVTKYYTLVILSTTGILFLTILEVENLKAGYQNLRVLVRTFFQVIDCWLLASLWRIEQSSESKWSPDSSKCSTLLTTSNSPYLPKSPPLNTSTLGGIVSREELLEGRQTFSP